MIIFIMYIPNVSIFKLEGDTPIPGNLYRKGAFPLAFQTVQTYTW